MGHFYFRLTNNDDPEERLEEAALWKALHDRFGDEIAPIGQDSDMTGNNVFGRPRRLDQQNPLPYWNDAAFLETCGRKFSVVPFDGLDQAISLLHSKGLGAFLKSTREKHWIARVPVGADWREVMDAMAYSFMDGGPKIMVQELCDIKYEWRFFAIDRKIITNSPNAVHLTPLDNPCAFAFRTPHTKTPEYFAESTLSEMNFLADDIASHMVNKDAVIDLALINGKVACVELNPLIVGGVGLFASDVRALADAIYRRELIADTIPT